jgi:ribosomal protein S18 acetylase RimI-like enzyme
MTVIKYTIGDEKDLDRIRPMWERLNLNHISLAKHFKTDYKKMKFTDRKGELLKKAAEKVMRVEIAYDSAGKKEAGYCVSTAQKNSTGEIESLYVDPGFRGSGIGKRLMKNALQWMEKHKVETKKIVVFAGNENVLDFYELYGFYPRYLVLQQKKRGKAK